MQRRIGILVLASCLAGWLSAPGVSIRAQEQEEPVKPAATNNRYDVRLMILPNSAEAIRFNLRTGKSWRMKGQKWMPILEDEKEERIQPGEYDVVVQSAERGFVAMRIERRTGASWFLKNIQWVKMQEQ
jgi:hypothetical protein